MGRLELVLAATKDEITRFNEALEQRTEPLILDNKMLNHGHTVLCMKEDFWLVTRCPRTQHMRSWCYCNDGHWADLLVAVGVERNELWDH